MSDQFQPGHDPAVDPARPAATATSTPTPADAASSPDTTEASRTVGGFGLGGYLDPTSAPKPVDEGGHVSAKPLLMIGAAGPDVAELGHLLAEHGYDNAVSAGKADAPPALDDALMALVIKFQQDHGIDPWNREGDGATNPPLLRRDHSGVVDARTWEALLGYAPAAIREGARA